QQVADEAVTLVRDNGKALPLPKVRLFVTESEVQAPQKSAPQLVAIIITDSVHGSWGRALENSLKSRRPDTSVFYVDNNLAAPLARWIREWVKDENSVLVAAYAAPTAGKQIVVEGKLINSVSLEQATGALLAQVLDVAAAKTTVVAMGSPYLAMDFGNIQTYICTYSNAPSSELSAVKVLFGELQPRG